MSMETTFRDTAFAFRKEWLSCLSELTAHLFVKISECCEGEAIAMCCMYSALDALIRGQSCRWQEGKDKYYEGAMKNIKRGTKLQLVYIKYLMDKEFAKCLPT